MDDIVKKVLAKIDSAETGDGYEFDVPIKIKKTNSNSVKYKWMNKIHDLSSLDIKNKNFLTEEDFEDEDSEEDNSNLDKHVKELNDISKKLKEISVNLDGKFSGISQLLIDLSKKVNDVSEKLQEQI